MDAACEASYALYIHVCKTNTFFLEGKRHTRESDFIFTSMADIKPQPLSLCSRNKHDYARH